MLVLGSDICMLCCPGLCSFDYALRPLSHICTSTGIVRHNAAKASHPGLLQRKWRGRDQYR